MNPNRLLVITANYNDSGQLDPYRQKLFREFEKRGSELLIVHATDFFNDVNPIMHDFPRTSWLVEKIKKFSPTAALYINAIGHFGPVLDLLTNFKIPILTWFWDHPAVHNKALLNFGQNERVAVANTTFHTWLKNQSPSVDVDFLPFPFFPLSEEIQRGYQNNFASRDIPILFMATLWRLDEVPKRVSEMSFDMSGLDRKLFYSKLERLSFDLNLGIKNTTNSDSEIKEFIDSFRDSRDALLAINNFFSSKDRLLFCSVLKDTGLKVYGPRKSWNLVRDAYLPDIDKYYQDINVTDPQQIESICARALVGLNVFHRQNQGGGTNFRFNEYISTYTPIVSNRNVECERIYLEGECAFYFSNITELIEKADTLSSDRALQIKLTRAAHEVSLDVYNVNKIVNSILAQLNIENSASFPQGKFGGCLNELRDQSMIDANSERSNIYVREIRSEDIQYISIYNSVQNWLLWSIDRFRFWASKYGLLASIIHSVVYCYNWLGSYLKRFDTSFYAASKKK